MYRFAHERNAFDQVVRVAKLALEMRRVLLHCPRAPTPEPSKVKHSVCVYRAPTLEPSNKARAPTQEPALSKRNVELAWCSVSSLSWLAVPVFFLDSGRWSSCPVPACSCLLFCFVYLFLLLAAGVMFQLPFRVTGTDPRTGFFRYLFTYVALVSPSPSSPSFSSTLPYSPATLPRQAESLRISNLFLVGHYVIVPASYVRRHRHLRFRCVLFQHRHFYPKLKNNAFVGNT